MASINLSGAVTSAQILDGTVATGDLAVGVLNGLTTVTAVSGDYVAIADASDSGNAKKALVSDITALAAASAATQAEMEAASSNSVFATPGRAQYHPGVAKGWVNFNGTGTVAIRASHNVSSITDNGAGDYTVNWTTAFSTENYAVVATGNNFSVIAGNPLTGSTARVVSSVQSGAATDDAQVMVIAFGDQ